MSDIIRCMIAGALLVMALPSWDMAREMRNEGKPAKALANLFTVWLMLTAALGVVVKAL